MRVNVSITFDIYAGVDPNAKKVAVSKVQVCFDGDFDDLLGGTPQLALAVAPTLTFIVGQLETVLAYAKAQEAVA